MKLPASKQPQEGQNHQRTALNPIQAPGRLWRVPLLAAAILTLLGAIWAGWIRMGWPWPAIQPSMVGAHGPLMVSGFFSTLISIERAVALRQRWPYVGPLLSGVGGILILTGAGRPLPALLLTAGSFWLVLVFAAILRMHHTGYTVVMALGALALFAANLLWTAGWPVYRVVLWWAAFLILTIAGERLELGRLVRLPRLVNNLFMIVTGLFCAGLVISLFASQTGTRLAAAGLAGLAIWLLRYDIARKTIRQTGLPRFAAICLLSGYAWLLAGSVIGLRYGAVPAGFIYDAFLHSIFLGFVFAMIFAHAPIIFPAILNIPVQYSPLSYLPLILLHLSLALRIAGDLLLNSALRMWGGLLNGITILIFLILTARSIFSGLRSGAKDVPAHSTERGSTEQPPENPAWPRRMWIWSLLALLAAGASGALLRLWMAGGFPSGIQYVNVRHAHSHLMFFAWVTPALMALIAARLPALTGRSLPAGMRWSVGITLVFGMLSFPPFFLWGYELAVIGGLRLPLSIAISTLNLLAWYAFALFYRRAVKAARPSRPLKLWNAALLFLMAASLGAWARAVLSAFKINDPFLAAAAVHIFLDLFSNGWAVLGLLGLAYAAKPELVRRQSGWEDPLLLLGLPLSFLLAVPVHLVPADLRTLASAGGLLAAAGLFLHLRVLWPVYKGEFWAGWGAPLALLAVKAGLDAAITLPALASWGEAAGLRILYLHILLLGSVTLALVTAGLQQWYASIQRQMRWLGWSAFVLLGSLLPLTGLWPAALGGSWRLWAAALFAGGPSLALIYILLRIWRDNEYKEGLSNREGKVETQPRSSQPVEAA